MMAVQCVATYQLQTEAEIEMDYAMYRIALFRQDLFVVRIGLSRKTNSYRDRGWARGVP